MKIFTCISDLSTAFPPLHYSPSPPPSIHPSPSLMLRTRVCEEQRHSSLRHNHCGKGIYMYLLHACVVIGVLYIHTICMSSVCACVWFIVHTYTLYFIHALHNTKTILLYILMSWFKSVLWSSISSRTRGYQLTWFFSEQPRGTGLVSFAQTS